MHSKISDYQLEEGGAKPAPTHHIYFKEVKSSLDRILCDKLVIKYHKYRAQAKRPGRRIDFLIYYNHDLIGAIGAANNYTLNPPRCVTSYCRLSKIMKERINETNRLNVVVELYRYTLIKTMKISSKIINLFTKVMRKAWYKKYKVTPKYILTFCKHPYNGFCYRAAGWELIGLTKGTGSWTPNPLGKIDIFKGQRLRIWIKTI
ncbi:hypothetical protein CMI37_27425 [Candidatus Pacearchaeota archaeon]|nr:hypothetical protein [Candidatus Pacearchaeota archaeon]|tara:strand:+ start:451 stop:1062 length:612 start_codon:yes stop_codon:yes gene_type:complete